MQEYIALAQVAVRSERLDAGWDQGRSPTR